MRAVQSDVIHMGVTIPTPVTTKPPPSFPFVSTPKLQSYMYYNNNKNKTCKLDIPVEFSFTI